MQLSLILFILLGHFIFDWLLQTRYMADNKSKSFEALALHVSTYTIGMNATFIFWSLTFNDTIGVFTILLWALINGILHGITDKITSQFTSRFYKQQRYHAFFSTIGFDQLIHYATLFISMYYIYRMNNGLL